MREEAGSLPARKTIDGWYVFFFDHKLINDIQVSEFRIIIKLPRSLCTVSETNKKFIKEVELRGSDFISGYNCRNCSPKTKVP